MHMPFAFKLNEATLTPLVNEDGVFCQDVVDFVDTWKVIFLVQGVVLVTIVVLTAGYGRTS